MQDIKQTPFYSKHVELGAKIIPFADYDMPVSYTGIKEEHFAVRNHAGLFDVSHMGQLILKGEHALDLIQSICSNDASKLTDGKAQYSCFTNDNGGIIDDLIVYCIETNKVYMLVVNASNIDKDWNWVVKHNTKNVELHNISDETCLLAVQGPKALNIVSKLTDMPLSELKFYTFAKGIFAGIDNVLVSATGYTGSGGVEIYFENNGDNASKIWDALVEAGKPDGLIPCGLGARDTLRLEMGYCLYGNDINDTTSPLEAGLGWITKFTKPFTAHEFLQNQKESGVNKKLVGFVLEERGIPRHDYTIHDANQKQIGIVTSGTQSPSLDKAIGMGYVDIEHAKIDSEIYINIREKFIKARIEKFPFYNHP